MIDPADNIAEVSTESATNGLPTATRHPNSMVLSIIGLAAGVIAIGLAAIPALALERPLPNPFADAKKQQVDEQPEREGGVTLKFKKLSVNVGGKVPAKKEPADAPPAITKDPVRWFTISAIGCALIGLVVSTAGQLREKHTALTVTSMGCCAAAITWQYFAVGIAVGAAAAAFLIVLAIFGSVLN